MGNRFICFIFLLCNALSFGAIAQNSNHHQQIDSLYSLIYQGPFYDDYETALKYLNQIDSIAQANNFKKRKAQYYINKSWLAQNFDDLQLMQKGIDQAKKVMKSYPDSIDAVLKGDIHYTEASYLRRLGDYLGAISAYKRIVKNELTDSLLFYDTYTSIGLNYLSAGNTARALENYELALLFLPKSIGEERYQLEQSISYQSIGTAYRILYQSQQDTAYIINAKKNLKTALSLLEPLSAMPAQRINKSAVLINLSEVYLLDKQYEQAIFYISEAKKLHRPGESFLNFIDRQIGDIYLEQGQPDVALLNYQSAIAIATENYGEGNVRTMELIQRIVKSKRLSNKLEQAIQLAQNGIQTLQKNKIYLSDESLAILTLPLEIEYVLTRYELAITQKELLSDAVLTDFQQLIETVETLRRTFPSRVFKEFISAKSKNVIEKAMHLAWNKYEETQNELYIKKAFWFSEKSKALTLLEKSQGREATKYADIPTDLLDSLDRLRRQITAFEELWDNEGNNKEYLLNNIEKSKTAFEDLVTLIEEKYPTYHQLKYDRNIPKLAEIQQQLAEDELILHYFKSKKSTFLIGISSKQTIFKKLKLNEQDLSNFLRCIYTNPVSESSVLAYQQYQEIASRLTAQLIDVEFLKDKTKLKILLDGKLNYIPFEALINPENDRQLITDFEISYDLSMKLSQVNNQYDEITLTNYLGFAPSYKNSQTVTLRNSESNRQFNEFVLGELAYNLSEVEEFKKIVGGQVFSEKSANERTFLTNVKPKSLFHLSAHGYSNNLSPLNSAVVFSEPNHRKGEYDNILHAYEVYGIQLPETMGILSACESGYGEYASGEGLISLQRAFYYAGCTSLVASLWNANDESSSQIIINFATYLNEGESRSKALRSAKLKFLKENSPAFRHPYYWANFILTGNEGKVDFQIKDKNWRYFILIPLMLFLLFFYWKKKSFNIKSINAK